MIYARGGSWRRPRAARWAPGCDTPPWHISPERRSSRAPAQDIWPHVATVQHSGNHYTIRHKKCYKGLQGHQGMTKYQAKHGSGQSLTGSGRRLWQRLGAAPLHRHLAGLLILARSGSKSSLRWKMNPRQKSGQNTRPVSTLLCTQQESPLTTNNPTIMQQDIRWR